MKIIEAMHTCVHKHVKNRGISYVPLVSTHSWQSKHCWNSVPIAHYTCKSMWSKAANSLKHLETSLNNNKEEQCFHSCHGSRQPWTSWNHMGNQLGAEHILRKPLAREKTLAIWNISSGMGSSIDEGNKLLYSMYVSATFLVCAHIK